MEKDDPAMLADFLGHMDSPCQKEIKERRMK
jgi:hypothetical protein